MENEKNQIGWMRRVRYFAIHLMSFFIFGLMCCLCILCLPVFCILSMGSLPRLHRITQSVTHQAFRFVVWFCRFVHLIQINIKNKSQIDSDNPILIANHISLFDVVAIFCYFPGRYVFVHEKFIKNPLLSPIIRCCGYIPVRPECPTSCQKALSYAQNLLNKGYKIAIFPEGSRSQDGSIGKFRRGVFWLSVISKKDITALFLTLDRPFLNKQKLFWPGRKAAQLDVWIMENISVSQFKKDEKSVSDLKNYTERVYKKWLNSSHSLTWTKPSNEKVYTGILNQKS